MCPPALHAPSEHARRDFRGDAGSICAVMGRHRTRWRPPRHAPISIPDVCLLLPAGIRGKLDRFAAQKKSDLTALQGQLATIHTSVSALHTAVSGQLADGLATVTTALQGMQAATASHAAGASAAEEAAQASVAAAVGTLVAAVDAQAAELRALGARQEVEAQAVLQAVQAMTSTVAAGCTGEGYLDGSVVWCQSQVAFTHSSCIKEKLRQTGRQSMLFVATCCLGTQSGGRAVSHL